jgi:hypothetical protein
LRANRRRAHAVGLAGATLEERMALFAFVVFAVIGQVLNVFLGLTLDHLVSPGFAVIAFVALYMLVFWFAWRLALLLFDRGDTVATEPLRRDRPMAPHPPMLSHASR